ncbi:N-acetylmuramoyl-L-alanine amidase family protein [Sphingomonas agri]|uniref:N-acetylmuramoyl-L-alanine amidase family protein n=1 Tax=Sphingomonas agri TaxID=1813878 RepID=UPI00311F7531
MTWLRAMIEGRARRHAIAGAAVTGIAAVALLVLLVGRGSDAAAQSSLTVDLPPPASDRIYGSPVAKGRPIVVIDAGHGGRDPGATSVSGQVREKELTLALAQALRDELVKRGRVRVAMTREDDRYLTLDDRAAVARRLNAAMFVSIHIDSAANPLARGASVYSLSDVASDAEAARLAARENADSGTIGRDGSVETMLADLAMRSQMTASADLASRLVNKAAGRVELRPNPHRFAAFHVLRRADAPAVLFEAGYLSNADDEVLLRNPNERSKMVLALSQAIETDIAAHLRR